LQDHLLPSKLSRKSILSERKRRHLLFKDGCMLIPRSDGVSSNGSTAEAKPKAGAPPFLDNLHAEAMDALATRSARSGSVNDVGTGTKSGAGTVPRPEGTHTAIIGHDGSIHFLSRPNELYAQLPQGADEVTQYLSSLTIGDSTPKPGEQPKPQAADKGDQHLGNTTIKRDGSGTINEYDNADYSLAKHDDGKWYYNQQGSSTYVEVDGNSIKMDDQGKVTYNESGFFGKDNQTLGNGSTGFLSSVTSAASHAAEAVADHSLPALTDIALPEVAIADAVGHTHITTAVDDVLKGAGNEIIHNPGTILKDAAIGAAIGALTVATGGGFAVGLAIGAGAIAATEIAKHGLTGAPKGALGDAKGLIHANEGWTHDTAVVAGPGQQTAQQEAEAQTGLEGLGSFAAQAGAGVVGGIAGGVGAEAAGLEGVIPNVAKASLASVKANLASDAIIDGEPVIEAGHRLTTTNPTVGRLIYINSPVSSAFLNRVVQTLDKMPPPVLKLLYTSGYEVEVGEKLTDISPDLKSVTPRGWAPGRTWDEADGGALGRSIVVTEKMFSSDGGKILADRVEGVTNHETGHAVDDALGGSSDPSFVSAYDLDLSTMPESLKTGALEYYVQAARPGAGASEAFAEGFGVLQGGGADTSVGTAMFQQYFPNVLRNIQDQIAQLPA
jgi:hypothetical protein